MEKFVDRKSGRPLMPKKPTMREERWRWFSDQWTTMLPRMPLLSNHS